MILRKTIDLGKSIQRTLSTNVESIWVNALRRTENETLRRIVDEEMDTVRTILRNTEMSDDHLTPNLRLFLLTPKCSLYHRPVARDHGNDPSTIFTDPFWSIYWPGGQGLARFLLEEGGRLFDSTKREESSLVLDLGAGCGAAAIAAKIAGARKVLANDIDKVACIAIAMNAIVNNADIRISQENLLIQEPDRYHAILVGDLLYDEEIAETLIPWLEKASKNDSRIYLGDPGRHGLTDNLKKRLRLLRKYELPENVKKENIGYDTTTVWQFL